MEGGYKIRGGVPGATSEYLRGGLVAKSLQLKKYFFFRSYREQQQFDRYFCTPSPKMAAPFEMLGKGRWGGNTEGKGRGKGRGRV